MQRPVSIDSIATIQRRWTQLRSAHQTATFYDFYCVQYKDGFALNWWDVGVWSGWEWHIIVIIISCWTFKKFKQNKFSLYDLSSRSFFFLFAYARQLSFMSVLYYKFRKWWTFHEWVIKLAINLDGVCLAVSVRMVTPLRWSMVNRYTITVHDFYRNFLYIFFNFSELFYHFVYLIHAKPIK